MCVPGSTWVKGLTFRAPHTESARGTLHAREAAESHLAWKAILSRGARGAGGARPSREARGSGVWTLETRSHLSKVLYKAVNKTTQGSQKHIGYSREMWTTSGAFFLNASPELQNWGWGMNKARLVFPWGFCPEVSLMPLCSALCGESWSCCLEAGEGIENLNLQDPAISKRMSVSPRTWLVIWKPRMQHSCKWTSWSCVKAKDIVQN